MKEINCPNSLNQLIRNYVRSNKRIEQRIKNPGYDNDRKLQIELRIDSPSLSFIISSGFEIEIFFINHIIKKLSNIYARLINQYKFRYQTVFSAVFDKQNEDEKELLIILNITHNLTQTDIDEIDVISQLKHKIHDEEMKDFDWQFYKINSMTVYFYNDSNAILNVENIDKHCFLQSIFDYLNSGEI